MQYVDEEEEDEYADDERRRNSTSQSSYSAHAPPSMTEDEIAEFEAAQNAARDSLGGWHYAPLAVALAPPLGALLGGHSDAWSDAILLILASFWLYQFLRVPWEIYYASRTRSVLAHDQEEEELEQADGGSPDSPSSPTSKKPTETAEQKEARQAAAAELRHSELVCLLFCVLSPLLGAYMLHWMRETMTDGNKYLNTFNIRLFTLAAGIKPWSHAMSLIRKRMLHLQEQVHYPSSKVESMNQRLRRIEADLSSLRKLYATKSELRVLKEYDAQLGRAVRRSERKEEHLRLSAEEKFSIVEGRLEDLLREVAINAELIEEERRERERTASLRISFFEAIKYLIGSGDARRASSKHYLHNTPRRLPSTAALGIGGGSPDDQISFDNSTTGALLAPASQTFSASTTSHGRGGAAANAHRDRSPTVTTSPSTISPGPAPPQTNDSHNVPRSRSRGTSHRVSDPWWERGMAFYLFLPLNVSSAVIRFAGEKVKHILEDSENEVARNQRKTIQYQKHLADQQLQQHQRKLTQQQQQQMMSPPRNRTSAAPTIKIASPPAIGPTSSRTR